jgi:hypothetical protein
MKSKTFAGLQAGVVDDPSIENNGGFEFASGMDIFSEPGVMKASPAMQELSYGTGAAPADVPRWMVDVYSGGTIRSYIAAGAKILESTNGSTYNLFLTNANGVNNGLGLWNGYVVYVNGANIGRAPVGNGAGKNDSYLTTLDSASINPIVTQGGTLKIGADRYVASLDESFTLTPRALKLPVGNKVAALAEHFQNLMVGVNAGSNLAIESSVYA